MSAHKATKIELISQLFWQMEIGADESLLATPCFKEKKISLKEYFLLLENSNNIEFRNKNVPKDSSLFKELDQGFDLRKPKIDNSGSGLNEKKELEAINSLKELRSALESLEGISLKNTATNLVFSDGNPDAKIMIVGEAPGKEEDKIGVPFVGQAGQLLDRMLKSVGLSRDQTYITNIIPWRPPGNRTPSQEEISLLKPFMLKHIQLKKPEIILALGGVSAKAILDVQTGILKLRGKIQNKNFGLEKPTPVVPTLHPAYLLRAPAQKKFAFADLVLLKRCILSNETSNKQTNTATPYTFY